ncbi:MAG: hypothetical protein FD180_3847 [Planctomycetota bacterium]|nr:MAG: hypothetical protein FD180_3847 [Planctomycetota bacterium]
MTSPSARPGSSPLLLGAVAILSLALGATGGALFEKSRKAPARETPLEGSAGSTGSASQRPPGETGADPGSSSSTSASTPGEASKRLADAQAEVARLTKRVAELEKLAPRERTKEDKIAIAKEMIECMRKGKRDTESFRRMLALLSELDPAMGPYFLERLADPEEKADKDMVIEFLMASGGPEVAEWLQAQLASSETDGNMRRRLLRILGGGSKEIFSIRNMPVTGPLANLAFQYATGENQNERQAAAGLFGGIDSVESRTALYRMAGSDTDFGVKEQAVRSLALSGDRETLSWLDTFQASLASLGDWEKKRLQEAVDSTREKLLKKYPQ